MNKLLLNVNNRKKKIIIFKKKIINNNNNNKFTFVHPTKCGGTSISKILKNNYSNFFTVANEHKTLCYDKNNPIILVRDPVDRFKSMYKYWKYGSEKYIKNLKSINYTKNVTVKDYINLIKIKSPILNTLYTWDKHYSPITDWIKVSNYKNLIIIKYCKDLNIPFQKMINTLNIPTLNIQIPHINISKTNENIIFDDEDLQFIKEYFKKDYELIELINTNPKLFRSVF
jgi:hypothetical protein